MSEGGAPDAPGDSRPAIIVRGLSTDTDDEFLKLYFSLHGGDVKCVALLKEDRQACVEFTDPSVIPAVLAKSHTIRKCAVTVEEVDLHKIWQPYLIVKGFPPFVNDQLLRQHFQKVANDAEIQSIEMKEGEASITYVNPQVALQVASHKQSLFGTELTVEVGYCSPKPQEECVLTVEGLPKMEAAVLKQALEWYFKQPKNGGLEVTSCDIVKGVAYIHFADPSDVQKVVSHPPTQEFMAGSILQMSTTPISKVPGNMIEQKSSLIDSPVPKQHQQPEQPPVSVESLGYSFTDTEPSKLSVQSPKGIPQQGKWAIPVDRSHSPTPRQWATQSFGIPAFGQQGQTTNLLGSSPVSHQQFPRQQQQPLVVEEFDTPPSFQPPQPVAIIPHKVLVQGFPDGTQEFVLQLYLQNLSQDIQCTEVVLHGKLAVATFAGALDFDALLQQSRAMPFPQNQKVLTLICMNPPDTVLVSNLPENTPEFAIQIYFEKFAPVAHVKFVSPTQALLTFKSHEGVSMVLKEQHCFGSNHLALQEYYSFMELPLVNEEHQQNISDAVVVQESPTLVTSPPPPKYVWSVQKEKISDEKSSFLQRTLGELNKELEEVHASASIEDEANGKLISIKPLPGSGDLSNWEDCINSVFLSHLSDFREERLSFPKEAKLKVLEYLETVRKEHPKLYVSAIENTLVIAGNGDVVNQVLEKVSKISEEAQITHTDFPLPKKHIKYLHKFCRRDLDSVTPSVKYNLDPETGIISVTANTRGLQAFMQLINEKTASISEKTMKLTPDCHKLLNSKKGIEKVETVVGSRISRLVYDFEVTTSQGHDGGDVTLYQLCFLSTEKEVCREVVKDLKSHVKERTVNVSQTMLKVCSSQEWKKFEQQLTSEFFVFISVKSNEIVVTGELIAVDGIADKIQKFLAEQTNIQVRLELQISEWRVLRDNCSSEITGVKDQAKTRNVKVVFPRQDTTASTVKVTLQGEPDAVSDIKVQVEMLKAKVHQKITKVAGVPALMHVLKGMEDKLKVLESGYKAVIEVDIESGENGASDPAEPAGVLPQKLCGATAPDATQVSVFTGDFTQHQHVGTLINFITPTPNVKQGTLKLLIDAGGAEVQTDFEDRISQFMSLNPSQVIKSRYGKLKCMQLLHCVIPPWSGGNQNEAFYLEEAFKAALCSIRLHDTLLITPATSVPFKYPTDIFASKVVEVLVNKPVGIHSSDIQAVVYVDELSHASQFEDCLKAQNFQINVSVSQQGPASPNAPQVRKPNIVKASVKAITSPISSFIKVTKGDMLQHQADVYINSTNRDLDLSQGQIAPLLLKACGKELQKDCDAYAPLEPTAVVDTPARNLKCKYIFHIALPDYKTRGSERIFRETVQNLLRTAHVKGLTSIVIPSIGVGNLHYPVNVSARILFDEVIAFHARNPSAIQMFHFVIYKKEDYQAFNKEYAQLLSGGSVSEQGPNTGATAAVHRKDSGQAGSTLLYVIQGNIADESTDVLVNTTTEDMNLSSNAVSKAIVQKAGPKLQSVCHQLVDSGLSLEKGNIAVTTACGQLHCKKVFHAYVPVRSAASRAAIEPKTLIEKIVTGCLQKTTEHNLQSVSFPAFGIGAGGYSIAETAEPMLKAIQTFGKANPKSVKTIRIVILDQSHYQEFHDYFCKFFKKDPAEVTQAGHGFLHSIGSSIKASLGMGHHEKGICVELQSPKGVVSVQRTAALTSWAYHSHTLSNPVALFTIYAASPQTCEQIGEKIRDAIRERSVTETIKEAEQIEFLIEDDIQEIYRLREKLGVVIKLMPAIKEIAISGEKASVSQAQMKIVGILREVESAQKSLNLYEWQSDDDGDFEAYPPEASVRLERAYIKKLTAIDMTIDNVDIVVDLNRMVEISKATGKERAVRREKKIHYDFPNTWEPQPEEGGRPKPCHMFVVTAGTAEFQEAVKEFEQTMTGLRYTIVGVKRVQNPNEYVRHCAFRVGLQQKYGKPKVEERHLFHGTREDSIYAIAVQGFNRSFAADANAACFGKGAYFAVSASYSAQEKYSTPDKSGNQHMFVCNVIIGKYTQGTSAMRVAPQLDPNTHLLYDSLVNNTVNPAIFVAMTDCQAYPKYLITFKIDKSKK